jgi:hypothetical protein
MLLPQGFKSVKYIVNVAQLQGTRSSLDLNVVSYRSRNELNILITLHDYNVSCDAPPGEEASRGIKVLVEEATMHRFDATQLNSVKRRTEIAGNIASIVAIRF